MTAVTASPATQHGVAVVSEQLFEKVTRYHAAIGADVCTSELARLENKLLEEGREACLKQQWEEALNLFTHALAVIEKSKTGMAADAANRGTVVHNVAFCLHAMGEFEAAKAYYEQSLECFQNIQVPVYQKVINGLLYPERLAFEAVYGGLNHNRIQMTKERLLDVSFSRKPDLTQLDQWGRKRPMADKSGEAGSDPNASYADQTRRYLASWMDPPRAQTYTATATVEDAPPDASDALAAALERKPGWLAASEAVSAADPAAPRQQPPYELADAPGAPADVVADVDPDAGRTDAEKEAARVEWLQYYLKMMDWAQAAELVVTDEEREDLAYLQEREERDAEYMRRREQRAT